MSFIEEKRKRDVKASSKSKNEPQINTERLFRDILEAAPVAIYEIDYNGPRFKSVNDAMCKLSGYSKEDLLSMNPNDLLDTEYLELFKDRIKKGLSGQQIDEIVEYKIKAKDGQEIWAVLKVKPIYREGKLDSALVIGYDITERKKAVEELKRVQTVLQEHTNGLEKIIDERTKQLKESERLAAIGATAGMVGHDIRNPLQAIAGDLYLIDNDIASLPENEMKRSLQESVKSIQDNLLYIAKIVDDLQNYAKPQKPSFHKIKIEKVIEEVMLLVPVSSNLQVVINVEEGFPEFTSDFSMLKRAVTNLVHNAVQAMPNAGKLTISAYQRANQVFVSVEDTGVGIPKDIKPKLFQPMVTTKAKGQGLGLAVVKRLVESLSGSITFDSQEGKGTKFVIELPINSNDSVSNQLV